MLKWSDTYSYEGFEFFLQNTDKHFRIQFKIIFWNLLQIKRLLNTIQKMSVRMQLTRSFRSSSWILSTTTIALRSNSANLPIAISTISSKNIPLDSWNFNLSTAFPICTTNCLFDSTILIKDWKSLKINKLLILRCFRSSKYRLNEELYLSCPM